VLYFASAKEAAGVSSEVVSLKDGSEMSVTQLFEKLEASHPSLKHKKILSSVAVAINLEYVELESGKIHAGDEVAIIPPVSGG
jgi:molybdopterin converting factor subunit 1